MTRYVKGRGADADLCCVFHWLLQRPARCILIDSYANVFMEDPAAKSSLSGYRPYRDGAGVIAVRRC